MEPSRSDSSHAHETAQGADRDAKIEQLLLAGLDHYFAARFEQAINVWTRALFLDRSHARARAYIERARSALAEAQRESEELLQSGVAAFHRGDAAEARRLLQIAIERGAPSEEALAVLERLNRLETAANPTAVRRAVRAAPVEASSVGRRRGFFRLAIAVGVVVAAGVAYVAAFVSPVHWRSLFAFQEARPAASATPVAREAQLPLPRRGEMALSRAKALAATGHLRDALLALDGVRPTDPERSAADRLRADIQRQLLSFTPLPSGQGTKDKTDRTVR